MEPSHVKISKRLVLFNSGSSLFSRVLNITVLVWMYQYLLKRIPAEEFEIYAVVAALITFAPLFSAIFTGGISRYIVDAYAKGEFAKVSEIHSSSLVSLAAMCLIGLVAGSIISLNIQHIVNVPEHRVFEAQLMMFLLVVNFFFQTVLVPYTVGFDVKQRYAQRELILIGREILRTIVLLLLLIGVSANVLWIVVSTVAANIVSVTLLVYFSRRMLPELRFSRDLVRRDSSLQLLSFGVWTTVGQLSLMLYRSGGAIVLNAVGTPVDVTCFHLGATVDRQIASLTSMASAPILPVLTAMNSTGDYARLGNTYLRGGRYALWASLFVAGPLIVFGHDFIDLYIGREYGDAATVMALLMCAYPFIYSEAILPKLVTARALMKHYTLGALFSSITIVLLMVFAAGTLKLGSIGIAGSILIGCAVSRLCYFWPLGFRLANVNFNRFARETLIPGLLPSLAALPCWLMLRFQIAPSTWVALGLCTLLGQSVYVCVILLFCLQRAERSDLARLFSVLKYRVRMSD